MPREAATDRIALRHFFVTPGVAAAHALSGLAIFAGAASVLKTTPLYLLGSIVPNPAVAASGSNLTFESEEGFPADSSRASLAHANRNLHHSQAQ